MDSRKILVASGEYELIHHARQSLTDLGFSFQGAYSHHDALHALRSMNYDAVMVHGMMRDRVSGVSTVAALSSEKRHIPLILYVPNEEPLPSDVRVTQYSFSGLDDSIIRNSVLGALHHFTAPLRNTQNLKGRDDAEYWDVDEVQTLLALTRSLTEVLDLSEVLNRVVEAARELTSAEEGLILLPEGDSSDLFLRARVGMDIQTARNFRVKTNDGIPGQVYRTGLPVMVGKQGPTKVKTEYFVNSALYVPILFKGQPIGVLGVNNRSGQQGFNSHHEALLLNLAAYAAVAIENARIHGQSVRRAREMRALVDASQAINSSLSLTHTLPTICEQVAHALGVNQVEILEWDRESATLHPLARYFQSMWRPGHEPVLLLSDFASFRSILSERRPALLRADKGDSRPERAYLRKLGIPAMLVIPIALSEDTLGAFVACYARVPNQLPSLEACQQVQHHALQVLVEHVDKGNKLSTQTLNDGAAINNLCGADWGEYWLLTPRHDAMTLHLAIGQIAWIDGKSPGADIAGFSDLVEILETQTLVNQHVDGDNLQPGVHALLQMTRGRSILGLPLVIRGQAQGIVLCVDTEASRVFNLRDVDMARAVVSQASTAFENARLVHDLEVSLMELRQTQARLIEAERLSAMGELAAAVAHQINNPLTTILVDSELMLLKEPRDSQNYNSLEAIHRAGKRAGAVVRRLLASVHRHPDDTPPTWVNVITTIEETLSLVKSHIERDGIQLVWRQPKQPIPPVMAIPGELEDVWLNLILNAHDALMGCPKPVITITAEVDQDEKMIQVHVLDNGPGIPEEIRSEIFNAFYTTKPIGEGTGLGLHICRQVVQRTGGDIRVQSVIDQWTRFTVILPVQKGF
jgi:signal transduction histidine kinase